MYFGVSIQVKWISVFMLGAICGSAISMDLLAQSMDPYSAQKSMDCADICGSLRVVACAVRGKYSPARQRYYRTRVCCAISVVIFLDSLHYMFGQLFPTAILSHTCLLCNFSCNISGQFALCLVNYSPRISPVRSGSA